MTDLSPEARRTLAQAKVGQARASQALRARVKENVLRAVAPGNGSQELPHAPGAGSVIAKLPAWTLPSLGVLAVLGSFAALVTLRPSSPPVAAGGDGRSRGASTLAAGDGELRSGAASSGSSSGLPLPAASDSHRPAEPPARPEASAAYNPDAPPKDASPGTLGDKTAPSTQAEQEGSAPPARRSRDAHRSRREVDRREPRRAARSAGNIAPTTRPETAPTESPPTVGVETAARARTESAPTARGETADNAQPIFEAVPRQVVDSPRTAAQGEQSETAPSGQRLRPVAAAEPAAQPVNEAAADARGDLRAELELLARAEAALRRNDPRSALQELDAHAHQFRSGQLRDERDGLRLIAQCGLDRDPHTSLTRYLQDNGDGVLHARVRAACARFLP